MARAWLSGGLFTSEGWDSGFSDERFRGKG
jgi:hypothetical protein